MKRAQFDGACSAWNRPLKFAFVGGLGILVQLVTLHWISSVGLSYLFATAIAVETAILHNFGWHENFTWADRNGRATNGLSLRFLRFHLSNGMISLAGNVLLMRIFVGGFGMDVLPANLLSIAMCCLTNFLASDRWVFAAAAGSRSVITKPTESPDPRLEAGCAARTARR